MRATWLGHGCFKFTTSSGQTILADPWVDGNPACPASMKTFDRLDTLLITHGHFDHIADAVSLAKKHQPKQVVGIYELCAWLEGKGVENTLAMNKGGSAQAGDLNVTMVHADHSCGIMDDGKIVYGGEAVGYIVRGDGKTLYFSGDTNVFGDMKLIADLYHPEVAFIPIGDLFTMGPREAAAAAKMLGAKIIVPMHFATFPALTGTPAALRDLLAGSGIEVHDLKPGESFDL
jgi:L-ascorbate metabolism protein UlaG (beta-lactamase superfamily)